jgi:hypothetical protein
MKNKLTTLLSNYRVLTIIFVLFAIGASFQSLKSKSQFTVAERHYTHYNNYIIFKNSYHHLVNDQDLYVLYPEEQHDLFKYTPSFAAFFGIFAALPDWLGLNLWNILNALLFLGAIYYLPKLTRYQQGLILIISLIELMTSMQNEQSNAIMAGLIILSFGLLEKNNYFFATLCLVLSVYIKLFGIIGFALFLFYPKKWKLALYSLLSAILVFLVPLIFIDFEQYIYLFKSFGNMLSNDHSSSFGYSVLGMLNSWFGMEFNKLVIVITGLVLFIFPFYKTKAYSDYTFRMMALFSVLIWVVIFNHKAESPTFIIAIAGVALWFVTSEKTVLTIALFIGAFVLTSLSPTDIFPRFLRETFVNPYSLKALPCILIWLKILYDMVTFNNSKSYDYQIS